MRTMCDSLDKFSASPMMQDAKKAYNEIFGNMPAEKKEIVNQLFGVWGFTQTAMEAYRAIVSKELDDKQRILTVGVFADMSLSMFNNAMVLLNKSLDETLKVADDTSAWLRSRNWSGLPCPTDENGACCSKTASEVYYDMIRFSKTRRDFIRQAELSDGGSPSKRG